jgi:hypothetical protein
MRYLRKTDGKTERDRIRNQIIRNYYHKINVRIIITEMV